MTRGPEIVVHSQADVPRGLREQVLALHHQAWPGDVADPVAGDHGALHDPALRPVSMFVVEGGRVLAALDILSKQIDHAGARYAASGLATVVTDEAFRGRGYGRKLVSAARESIAASGADLGIFTCDRPLAPFYLSAGWAIVPGAVLVGGTPDDPFPSDQWDKLTLAAFFTAKARCGAEKFANARVALYSGTIDRLW